MVIGAISLASPFSPGDLYTGATARRDTASQLQSQVNQGRGNERVIQGEVVGRAPLQQSRTALTGDALAERGYKGQDSGLAFSARNAVNTYIGQQAEGERIDRFGDNDRLIDEYV